MLWFPGPFSLACQVSKKNKALLVVFIDDGSDSAQKMSEFFDAVDQSVFTCPVVSVHLKTGDDAFKQFSYPTPVLPATYFIDDTSNVLKILTLLVADNSADFIAHLKEVVKLVSEKSNPIVEIPSSTESATSTNGESPDLSLAEKIARAKELLEKKRKDDEEKKRSDEKEKELERIRGRKLMQEAAQKRQEQELVELAIQRRREKMEAEAEKERVRAQIKADREEREYRMQRGEGTAPTQTPLTTDNERPPVKIDSDRCRVQVRMPENKTFIEEFASTDSLSKLVDIIKESGQVTGSFDIVQTYPRHKFTAEEMHKSFVDLYLTPSCTLTVEQARSSSMVPSSNFLGYIPYLFSLFVISPMNYVFGIITGFFGSGNTAVAAKKDDPPSTNSVRRGTPGGGDASVRRRGNVSGLHNPNDNDEDASWNGNSTQFM